MRDRKTSGAQPVLSRTALRCAGRLPFLVDNGGAWAVNGHDHTPKLKAEVKPKHNLEFAAREPLRHIDSLPS